MYLDEIREYCLGKPDVEETLPFGPDTLVYKVNGKMFLLTGFDNDPVSFNVKCDPDKAVELREEFSASVFPGYHMNKKHWNTILVNGTLSDQQLREMIDESYHLVKGKKSTKSPNGK
ncbi:MAG: MmcQ/YjbR family DNA-binding protein [Sphingobacteriia bacterium]|nr:MmcQ/YjbR family DNA-binding protein [Sphingobacteriia bacterium]